MVAVGKLKEGFESWVDKFKFDIIITTLLYAGLKKMEMVIQLQVMMSKEDRSYNISAVK